MTKSKSFNEYILNDLKTDDEIKEWINIGFQEFLQDNDLNAFVKALEYVVRAKILFLEYLKRQGFQEVIFMQFLMENNNNYQLL